MIVPFYSRVFFQTVKELPRDCIFPKRLMVVILPAPPQTPPAVFGCWLLSIFLLKLSFVVPDVKY
jgi:hypothetical protein